MIRRQPFYRHDAFMAGLKAAGFQVYEGAPKNPPYFEDVLCIWNRYGEVEAIADRFEAAGGTVMVAENGYLNPGGGNPKFDAHEGKPGYYALALDGHNGSGRWPEGGPERWEALGIEPKPYRIAEDGDILICPSRPFGSRKMMPPQNWEHDVARRYSGIARTRIRMHPGNSRPTRDPLEGDLRDCKGVVIWASTAGVHALIAGIPTVAEAPYWVCACAGDNVVDNRRAAFERLAWAQWHINEIASGEPFERLMECTSTALATSTT